MSIQARDIAIKASEFCELLDNVHIKAMKQGAIYSLLCMLKDNYGEDFEEPLVFFLAHGSFTEGLHE